MDIGRIGIIKPANGLPRAGRAARFPHSTMRAYLALIAYLALAKIALALLPVSFTDPSQAAIFDWTSIAILAAAGLIGSWFAEQTGFAPAWGGGISVRNRLLIPALAGMSFGIVSLAINHMMQLPKLDIAFPASALVYSGGAIAVEVFYRLGPLPIMHWLLSAVLLRGRWPGPTFAMLAALLSTLEPLGQGRALLQLGVPALPLAVTVFEIYLANLTQAYLFRRFGFLASLTLRLGHYFLWHVIGSEIT